MRAWQLNDDQLFEEGLRYLELAIEFFPEFSRAESNLQSGKHKYEEMTGRKYESSNAGESAETGTDHETETKSPRRRPKEISTAPICSCGTETTFLGRSSGGGDVIGIFECTPCRQKWFIHKDALYLGRLPGDCCGTTMSYIGEAEGQTGEDGEGNSHGFQCKTCGLVLFPTANHPVDQPLPNGGENGSSRYNAPLSDFPRRFHLAIGLSLLIIGFAICFGLFAGIASSPTGNSRLKSNTSPSNVDQVLLVEAETDASVDAHAVDAHIRVWNDRASSPEQCLEASDALVEIGSDAVPLLLGALESGNTSIGSTAESLPTISVTGRDGSVREFQSGRDGPSTWAGLTLARIGSPAVEVLKQRVHDEDPRLQYEVRSILEWLGHSIEPLQSPTPSAIADWVAVTNETETPLRNFAFGGLRLMDDEGAREVVRLFFEPDGGRCRPLMEAKWFPVDPLLSVYTDTSRSEVMRNTIGEILVARDPDPDTVIPPLAKYLVGQSDGRVSKSAITLIGRYANQRQHNPDWKQDRILPPDEAVSVLLHCTTFEPDEGKALAIETLVGLSSTILDHILPSIKAPDEQTEVAFEVLKHIGTGNPRVLASMVEAYENPPERIPANYLINVLDVFKNSPLTTPEELVSLIGFLKYRNGMYSNGTYRAPAINGVLSILHQRDLPTSVLLAALDRATDRKDLVALGFVFWHVRNVDQPPPELISATISASVELLRYGFKHPEDQLSKQLATRRLREIGLDNPAVQEALLEFYGEHPQAFRQHSADRDDITKNLPLSLLIGIAEQNHPESLAAAIDLIVNQPQSEDISAAAALLVKALQSEDAQTRRAATSGIARTKLSDRATSEALLVAIAKETNDDARRAMEYVFRALGYMQAELQRTQVEEEAELRVWHDESGKVFTGNLRFVDVRGGIVTLENAERKKFPVPMNKLEKAEQEYIRQRDAKNFRTWQTATGQFTVEAKFIQLRDGVVTLAKKDGAEVDVPLERLSLIDQYYVRRQKTRN
jgi:hypothetical protein